MRPYMVAKYTQCFQVSGNIRNVGRVGSDHVGRRGGIEEGARLERPLGAGIAVTAAWHWSGRYVMLD